MRLFLSWLCLGFRVIFARLAEQRSRASRATKTTAYAWIRRRHLPWPL